MTTTTTDAKLNYQSSKKHVDDPEEYRMSIGEHLEELRHRMIMALVGFVIVLFACLYFGNDVVAYFCRPLLITLESKGLPGTMFERQLGGTFMTYLSISMISAAAISAPWAIYQIWMFVAAGLYPNERRVVMRYAPLSIVLLIGGMLFVYFVVLPWTIEFFIDWSVGMPLPAMGTQAIVQLDSPLPTMPVLKGDPDLQNLPVGSMWFNELQSKPKVLIAPGVVRSYEMAPMSLVVPQYELRDYVHLVVVMLLMFGLAFQLPLVVAALLKIGIVDAEMLRAGRKYVYFALLIVAAAITPGDVITATIALMIPLILLYEFGIILGAGWKKEAPREK
jgi:sec-independent protein translocase protein TatC